ncbi:tetratricopeptide repeat protein [Methanococcus voltae]|uniref:tetratricopeptide repeat protein n=1 Tax=Methanococcus voltae TaxID=2188 RepID=UPI001AE3E3F1|nr:hypothetical protein [Methanococcus voltae]MBP2173291.1 Tfp pilus assembly protein PilF [Methanococcus voltae]
MENKINNGKDNNSKTQENYTNKLIEAAGNLSTLNLDEALILINKALSLKNDDYEAYLIRGGTYALQHEYKKAMVDFEKAKTLGSPDLKYYCGLGTIHYIKGEYSEAIKYYNMGLPTEASEEIYKDMDCVTRVFSTYISRAFSYSILKNYEKAQESYEIAKRIINSAKLSKICRSDKVDYSFFKIYANSMLYTSWGDGLQKLEYYDESIKKYDMALHINYENTVVHTNRLYAYYNKSFYCKNGEKTFDGIYCLLEDTFDKFTKTFESGIPLNDSLSAIYTYYKTKISEELKDVLIYTWMIYNEVFEFKNKKLEKFEDGKNIVHYTKPHAIKALIPNEEIDEENNIKNSYFRLYNAIYMNDPEEGILLIDALKENYQDLFNDENDGYNPQATFICSFLKEEDELFLWRTYGKDEREKEARGLNLVFNRDYFDQDNTSILQSSKIICDTSFNKSEIAENDIFGKTLQNLKDSQNVKYNLYDVTYVTTEDIKSFMKLENTNDIDDKKLKELANFLIKIKEPLLRLQNLISNLEDEEEIKAVSDMTISILKDVSYLIKSKSYKEEQEMRVLVTLPIDDKEHIKFDPKDTYPQKMYINIEKSLNDENGKYGRYIKKVTLGPNLKDKNRWIAYLNRKGLKVKESTHKIQ